MKMWARIGLGLLAGFVVLAGVTAINPKPQITMRCNAQGGAGDCVIENKGGRAAQVEFDAVLVCNEGEHVAHVSAQVDAHNHVTKVIDGFSPDVGMFAKCVGIDYRNRVLR